LPGPYLAWSPDGNYLVIADRDSPTSPSALFLLSIENGQKQKLTFPSGRISGDSTPAFSPDGLTLGFSRNIDFGVGDLFQLSLLVVPGGVRAAGEAKRITFDNRGARNPVWSVGGRDLVFTELGFLSRVSASRTIGPDDKPRQLMSFGGNVREIAISRGAHRLAYAHVIFHSNIWRLAMPVLDSGPNTHLPNKPQGADSAIPFISSTRDSSAPQYSPDGKRIAFMSDRTGSLEIWVCDSDGSHAVQLTSFGGPDVTTPRWSPDGKRIAFDSSAAGQFDIWTVNADGGKPERITTNPANDGNPSWSNDGRWIYFDSGRIGEQQVWKVPVNGGEAIQLTRDGGFSPLESLDGKFLYYVKNLIDTSVWRIPVEGGQAIKVVDGLSNYLNVAIVDKGVIFVPSRQSGARSSVQFFSFATNKIRPIADFEKPLDMGGRGGVAVSPDGRWLLFSQFDQAGSELMLVDSFR
jgi:Tol biopolymer transport system component